MSGYLTNSELKEQLTDLIALLRVPGIGRGRYRKLTDHFGSPSAVIGASVSKLAGVPGISRTIATAIKEKANPDEARTLAARVIQLGWTPLFGDSPEYPVPLRQIPEAPPVLFRLGEAYSDDDRMIAIVGTRRATERGKRFTHNLAVELAKAGITVVSGMAEGIDSAAHQGALDGGGKTVAIWGTSLETVYPPVNRPLAKKIAARGAVYSEYLPGTAPDASHFPERNRIISGMSEGVIVVEAGERSGALLTADLALEQGRELFAVPGSPDSARSIGANRLIKRGARLLTSIDDVFEELPRLKGQVAAKKFRQLPDLTELEEKMLKILADGPMQLDQLSRKTGLKVAELMEVLLALELKGVVQELSGKRFVLSD